VNGIELDEYDPGIRERLLKRFRTSPPLPITPLESLELALLKAVREIERLREQCERLEDKLRAARQLPTAKAGGLPAPNLMKRW